MCLFSRDFALYRTEYADENKITTSASKCDTPGDTPKGVATDEESANVYSKTKRREINPRPTKYNNLYLTAVTPNFNYTVPINPRLFFVSSYAIIDLLTITAMRHRVQRNGEIK